MGSHQLAFEQKRSFGGLKEFNLNVIALKKI